MPNIKNKNQAAKRHLIPTPATLNRREAEMGFGDEIPKRTLP